MKAFLEEYGLIVVVCIVIAVLIALAVWGSKKGSDGATSAINGFTKKVSESMTANGVTMGDSENLTGGNGGGNGGGGN